MCIDFSDYSYCCLFLFRTCPSSQGQQQRQKNQIRNFKVDRSLAVSTLKFKRQLRRNYAETPSKLPRNWGIVAAQLIPTPGGTTQHMRLQMGIKERNKLNAPAAEVPPREMGVGSHRDGNASFRTQ